LRILVDEGQEERGYDAGVENVVVLRLGGRRRIAFIGMQLSK